jgi:hypothetical protein
VVWFGYNFALVLFIYYLSLCLLLRGGRGRDDAIYNYAIWVTLKDSVFCNRVSVCCRRSNAHIQESFLGFKIAMQISIEKHFKIKSYSLQYMISQHVLYNIFHAFCCIVTNSAACFELYIYLFQDALANIFFCIFFWRARVCWTLLCLCCPFCIFERFWIRTQRAAFSKEERNRLGQTSSSFGKYDF